jgi:hypothetical protein
MTVGATHWDSDLEDRWTDVFRSDAFLHFALMASIVAATFQGWLKDRIPGFGPYLISDLCLVAAFLWWTGGLAARRMAIVGPRGAAARILILVAVPTLYLIVPGTPLAIQVAGLRAWSAFPIAALIALSVIRTPGQVRAYVGLILVLCVVAGAYGIWQYRMGPQQALGISELAQLRHGSTVYYGLGTAGEREFRAFSTFTYPAPFAMMMVFGMTLAAGVAASRRASAARRWLALLLLPLFFVGMTVSGTRAALVNLLFALVILAWYRRLSLRQALVIPMLALGLHLAVLVTGGRIIERYQTLLLTEGMLWTYVWAPVTIAWRALQGSLFGLGLGRSGVGVPYFIVAAQPQGFIVGSDGDIGRAAVEMGLVGIALLLLIVVGLLPAAARAVRVLREGDADDIALGVGPLIGATGLTILIGSPLSATPHAIIWWVLLGALLKLSMLREDSATEAQQAPAA